jgi:uncharacterized glyoxalase superfamily protein PhnB
VAFYRDDLQLAVLESWRRDDDDRGTLFSAGAGVIEVLFLARGQASSHRFDDRPPQGVFMAIETADVDSVHELAVARRLTIQRPLTTQPWGHRSFCLLEPNGLTLYVFSQG